MRRSRPNFIISQVEYLFSPLAGYGLSIDPHAPNYIWSRALIFHSDPIDAAFFIGDLVMSNDN